SPLWAASESASPANPIPITAIATRRLKAISGLPFYIEVVDEWLLRKRPRRRQRRFVVRMIGHFLHVLYVLEGVIFIQNENRAALNPHVFDQRSIVLTERSRTVIRQHLDLVHSVIAAPAFLRKRQVHAYGVNLYARQFGGFFVEALGLRIAHRCIERGHHAED